ncbi:MAG: methyltransferase domain-containing protein [Imperialibacter sp.]|uniref:methyltransferase domain-containing protein n=1 Tax=Imperialibacter sp. TaxID=2038411 RepID=UPI0032EFF679
MSNAVPDFSQRSVALEWMDDLSSSGDIIVQTLKELDTINRLLGGNSISLSGLKKLLSRYPEKRKEKIVIADIGCGGGDIMKLLAGWGRKNNLQLELIGIDANPHVLEYARENTKDFPEIRFEQIDIYSKAFSGLKFDIIHTSLFTHHFPESELIAFYSQWVGQVNMGIINNDLHRHWFAYHSIDWLTRLFSRSPMVKYDARLSVLRSFLKPELEDILYKAKIQSYDIQWKWAFRWELVIYA